jgi:hypothetical protein
MQTHTHTQAQTQAISCTLMTPIRSLSCSSKHVNTSHKIKSSFSSFLKQKHTKIRNNKRHLELTFDSYKLKLTRHIFIAIFQTMNFNFALFLLAAPSLVQGDSNLRGSDGRALNVATTSGFGETLGSCLGATCGMWGDPHIVTCDGLGYDCQGVGIFTLMKNHMYNIQANFVTVGAREQALVEGWGLTEGASLTNDVIIDFLDNEAVPIIQLGFGDVTTVDGSPPSEEGCLSWKTFNPINMAGQGRSVENLQSCRQRCAGIEGCTSFSYWANGGCHMQDGTSLMVDSNPNWSRAVAGYMDGPCGVPIEEVPDLDDPMERYKHGIIGKQCPLLMYVDGELVDISGVNSNGMLLGTVDDDFYVKMVDNSLVQVVYKTKLDDYAEIHLRSKGDGPGEIWSCHWDFYVCLPESESEAFETQSTGLMGTPDGNTQNDWMDPAGNTLVIQNSGTDRHKNAFDYCVDNWCVSQVDSLMTYHGDNTYEDHKCEDQEYIVVDIYDPSCVLSPEKIIETCASRTPFLIAACEVDCCVGGCAEFVDQTEDEIVNFKTLSEDETDIQYDVPVHNQCAAETGFLNTGDTVCPGESIVTLLKSSGGVDLPGDAPVIYGLSVNLEPSDSNAGMVVKFKVNNPFNNEADVYVKHDNSVFTTFTDSVCDAMPAIVSGCDLYAADIEVACHEYPGVAPFAIVQVYFAVDGLTGDATVDKCCKPTDHMNEGVVMYTFEVQCTCTEDVVS